jgi:hypothetical protein
MTRRPEDFRYSHLGSRAGQEKPTQPEAVRGETGGKPADFGGLTLAPEEVSGIPDRETTEKLGSRRELRKPRKPFGHSELGEVAIYFSKSEGRARRNGFMVSEVSEFSGLLWNFEKKPETTPLADFWVFADEVSDRGRRLSGLSHAEGTNSTTTADQ